VDHLVPRHGALLQHALLPRRLALVMRATGPLVLAGLQACNHWESCATLESNETTLNTGQDPSHAAQLTPIQVVVVLPESACAASRGGGSQAAAAHAAAGSAAASNFTCNAHCVE